MSRLAGSPHSLADARSTLREGAVTLVRSQARSLADRIRSTLFRRGRTPGLRTAKVTLAVVAAYLLAEVLHLSEHPIVAPLVALLVVQLTLYQSIAHGLGRVGGVLAGVAVAVLVAHFVGLTWWSLGAVVAGSIVVGKVLRLGPHLFEAPISAMLLLEVGGGGTLGLARVEEAILGALVGIAVSMLVAPPLYLQPAGAAIGELAERMGRFAAGVRRRDRGAVVPAGGRPLDGAGPCVSPTR